MQRPPREPQASLFNEGLGRHITWVGIFIGLVSLAVAAISYDPAHPEDQTWQTILFTTLAFLQVGQALASRSSKQSFFKLGWRSNPTLLWLILVVVFLQLLVVYLPALESFFHVDPLTIPELLLCIVAGSLAFWAIELEKWWLRRNGR